MIMAAKWAIRCNVSLCAIDRIKEIEQRICTSRIVFPRHEGGKFKRKGSSHHKGRKFEANPIFDLEILLRLRLPSYQVNPIPVSNFCTDRARERGIWFSEIEIFLASHKSVNIDINRFRRHSTRGRRTARLKFGFCFLLPWYPISHVYFDTLKSQLLSILFNLPTLRKDFWDVKWHFSLQVYQTLLESKSSPHFRA